MIATRQPQTFKPRTCANLRQSSILNLGRATFDQLALLRSMARDRAAGRIQALANVHALFVKSQWGGAELSKIVTQELVPYLGQGEVRAQIDGPHVFLATNTAQAIAMTLHELATNAAKYGSLFVPNGYLCVKWSPAADGQLTLHWTESGGPPTKKPSREGFGMSVIKRMIQEQW
jgi:two-component sensor histidine kinase